MVTVDPRQALGAPVGNLRFRRGFIEVHPGELMVTVDPWQALVDSSKWIPEG
jgi:hypothetical protein